MGEQNKAGMVPWMAVLMQISNVILVPPKLHVYEDVTLREFMEDSLQIRSRGMGGRGAVK